MSNETESVEGSGAAAPNETAPKTLEAAFRLAESLAQHACDEIFAATGERPHVERRASSIVVVWPDGEVTNEIEVAENSEPSRESASRMNESRNS